MVAQLNCTDTRVRVKVGFGIGLGVGIGVSELLIIDCRYGIHGDLEPVASYGYTIY